MQNARSPFSAYSGHVPAQVQCRRPARDGPPTGDGIHSDRRDVAGGRGDAGPRRAAQPGPEGLLLAQRPGAAEVAAASRAGRRPGRRRAPRPAPPSQSAPDGMCWSKKPISHSRPPGRQPTAPRPTGRRRTGPTQSSVSAAGARQRRGVGVAQEEVGPRGRPPPRRRSGGLMRPPPRRTGCAARPRSPAPSGSHQVARGGSPRSAARAARPPRGTRCSYCMASKP